MNALKPMVLFSIVMDLLSISCASRHDRRPDFGDHPDMIDYKQDCPPIQPRELDMDEVFEELHEWNKERPNRGGRPSR